MHLRLFRLLAGIASLSAIASLHAQVAPTIASVSSSQTITEGQSILLSVSVNGTTPFTYQWFKGSTEITGATSSTYALSPVRATDDGAYTVVVTNSAGTVTAGPIVVAVTLATAPSYYSSGGTTTVTAGSSFSFYASASGTDPITYQWYKDEAPISGATSYYYSKNNATSADAGSYKIIATNIAGSASRTYTLVVNAPTAPTFSSTPASTTVTVGGELNLYAYAEGSSPISYQWYKNGLPIIGANYTSYTRYVVTAADAGSYTVTATNTAGSVTSPATTVTVNTAAVTKPTIQRVTSSPSRIVVGGYFYIWVNATGTSPLSYQWYKDGVAISGATDSTYTIYSPKVTDVGSYTVVVTNAAGSATSEPYLASAVTAGATTITYHPASRTVNPGTDASFHVNVSSSSAYTLQWYKNGTLISGATSSSLYLYGITTADAGTYHVTVTTSSGTLTSHSATLTVLAASAPVFTSQPVSKTLRPGEGFSVSASASGYPSPTFHWQRDGENVVGATSSSFTKYNVAASDAGSYTLVATNSAGTVTSAAANLTVLEPEAPVITSHPTSISLLPGSYRTLSISLRDSYGATVQWYRNGEALSGATGNSYYISSAQPSHAGTYYAVVTNSEGSATSHNAIVTVDSHSTRPAITYTSGSYAVTGGETASLEVSVASGATVQWYKDDVAITGATKAAFSIGNFSASDAGTYTAKATLNSVTTTSADIVLTLRDSGVVPRIITHPVSGSATAGSSASFSVTADGERPLTYQWKKDGNVIAGATNSSFSIYSVTGANTGSYTVTVKNAAGETTSGAATLAVTTAALTAPPVITRHPASQTITLDSSGYGSWSLDVSLLSSSSSVSYQWIKDGVEIPGATSYYYSKSYPTSADSGSYTVTVTNSAGSVTSNAAVVTVRSAIAGPVFTTHPAGTVLIPGQSITFTAAATSSATSGTMTYQWRKNGVDISGATGATYTVNNAQFSAAGTFTVVAADVNGATTSKPATLAVSDPVAPAFTQHPTSVTVSLGSTATFAAAASGVPAPAYQWYFNGTPIADATSSSLSVGNVQADDIGSYSVKATNSAGSATSNAAKLSIQFPYAGIYFGSFSDKESCAMIVREDRTAVFLGSFTSQGLAIVTDTFTVDYDGTFRFDAAKAGTSGKPLATRYSTGIISGQFGIGYDAWCEGTASPGGIFIVTRTSSNTAFLALAGQYEAVPLATGEGMIHAIVSSDGRILVVSVDADGVHNFVSAIAADGSFSSPQDRPYSYSGLVDKDSDTLTGTYTPSSGAAPISLATPATKNGPERLANLSTRGVAGTDDRTLIAGFVITGNTPKTVLIRAAGPSLTEYDVANALANPRLTIYKGTSAILENDNWSANSTSAAAIRQAAQAVGAFPFPEGSADAAVLTELAPGQYTAYVNSAGNAPGVALVEAYDVDTAQSGAPKLINISTRGGVGTGDDILVVGLVVTGNAPKRLLIRGIGPALTPYGVNGVLANPKLSLFQGTTALRSNDDWSAGIDAAAIAAAAKAVGAFALPEGSKDAAMLLYLAPGLYTAEVRGANNTTGVALVEAYEVP